MTPDQAADLAARTLAAIDEECDDCNGYHSAADRERVASDLAGLRDHRQDGDYCWTCDHTAWPCIDARRYADGLRRTAALYGVTEDDSLWDDKADAARAEYLEDR